MTQSPLQSRPGPVERLRVQLRARQVALQRPGESDGFRLVCCTSDQDGKTGAELRSAPLLLCTPARGNRPWVQTKWCE